MTASKRPFWNLSTITGAFVLAAAIAVQLIDCM
jgi:hypothetical protein